MSGAQNKRDIGGRYQLREALAKRPVGRWFRAHDHDVDVDVGLLLVNPELLPDADSQDRFIGAVVEMRSINHRHLLRLFDVGREGDSVYLTAQMSQPIRALYKADGVLQYANSVADALDAVHRAGQTHGRLTPSDICEVQKLIKVSGAGLYGGIPPAIAMRVWRGLSSFWAPEVVRGEMATPAADVYSLAAISAVLLSSGKSADPHRALEELETENRAVYDALSPAMSVTADDRPASPSLLVNRLASALDDEELDEQETTYFVKASIEELTGDADGKLGPFESLPGAKPKSDIREKIARGKRSMAGPGTKPVAKPKPKPKSHDRTVVEAVSLPAEDQNGGRKVPAMVAMGAPVGPSGTSSRGKEKARRGPSGVPQAVHHNADATERMDASHVLPKHLAVPSRKKLPPTVARGSSWVAHASKPAIEARPKPQTRPRPEKAAGTPDDKQTAPVASRSSDPSAAKRDDRKERSGPAKAKAGQRPKSSQDTPTVVGKRPVKKTPAPAARAPALENDAAPAPAQRKPDSAGPAHPAPPKAAARPPSQAPAARPSQAPAARPAQAPAPRPASASQAPVQQANPHGYTPSTHPVGQPGGNLTWVYLVLAAIASATLAILVAMALFGD